MTNNTELIFPFLDPEMKKLFQSMAVFMVCSILIISLLLDPFFPFHAYWWFTIPMCVVVACISTWITAGRKRGQRVKVVSLSVLLVFSMRYWDFNSRKSFLRRFNGLENGDTREEVLQHMEGYRYGQGKGFIFARTKQQHPDVADRVENVCFTHTREGWGNSDWGLVYFVDGKLWDTQFSHD